MTRNHGKRDSAVMISSVIPSLKYSCSGSPDMLANGRTAMEGLSESERAPTPGAAGSATSPFTGDGVAGLS